MSFSGSYDPDDVQFLLKPVAIEPTEVREKERLIQSGGRHYSEMIGIERPPEQEYLRLFYEVFETNRHRFAHDVVRLARRIAARISGAITLVSLARAGTPIGVLLRRTLRRLGRPGMHFSISIIRDHGWDNVAVDKILQTCEPYSVVFIDGWTGKGAIAAELRHSIAGYSARHGFVWQPSLAVVADPAGVKRYVGLVRTAAGVSAFEPSCTHQGYLLEPRAGEWYCDYHGSRFAAGTGDVLAGPARTALRRYEVAERDGTVFVSL